MKPLFVLLLLVAASFVAACGEATLDDTAGDPVRIEEFHYSQLPGGTRIVSGTLRNATSAPIGGAQIQVGLFDADNRLLTTMSITVHDLAPGESKPFRHPVDRDNVAGAKVRTVLVL